MHRRIRNAVLFVALMGLLLPGGGVALEITAPRQLYGAVNPLDAFQRTHDRTDLPVAEGVELRTWVWGQDALTDVLDEPYGFSEVSNVLPTETRPVQYFDKARMEINDPAADPDSAWYVTNGLLVMEMITGQMQVSDDNFLALDSARVNVAGDAGDPDGPTYATFAGLLDAVPHPLGQPVITRIDRAGNVTTDETLASYGVEVELVDNVTGHAIVAPFWAFMNSSGTVWNGQAFVQDQLFENAYFATGRPVTEAYWATVEVGGTEHEVLMQCFERRCLTYTPGNPEGFIVEAGNVGLHYYSWRYSVQPLAPEFDGRLLYTDGVYLNVFDHEGASEVLQAPDGFEVIDPTWSPDGSRIAYLLSDVHEQGELHIVNADGSNDLALIPGENVSHPDWSPDGQLLVFTSGEDSDTIETINVDGTGRTIIGTGLHPRWSPQGNRIAFIAEQPNDELLMVFEVLSTMDPDGSDIVEVVSRPENVLPGYGGIDEFAWSPDGTRFVYGAEHRISLYPFLSYDLHVVNADGSGDYEIPPVQEAGPNPGWTPDGSRVTYSREHVIYAVNPDGSDVTGIVWDFNRFIRDFDWTD